MLVQSARHRGEKSRTHSPMFRLSELEDAADATPPVPPFPNLSIVQARPAVRASAELCDLAATCGPRVSLFAL